MQELIAGLGLLGPILIVVIIWLAACIRVATGSATVLTMTVGTASSPMWILRLAQDDCADGVSEPMTAWLTSR